MEPELIETMCGEPAEVIGNHERVIYGACAISMYDEYRLGNQGCTLTLENGIVQLSDDPQDMLVDLLTDLRHWAASCGLEFLTAVDASQRHFLAERKGE